jgi:hypothetical protein
VSGRHDQLPLVFEQDRALDKAIMGKWKSTERRVDLAHGNRRELVQNRQFHPFDIEMKPGLKMPDKWQGHLVKAATEEADPQPVRLANGGIPAVVQRGAEDQGSGLCSEAKFLAKGRQLNPPARSHEELPPDLFLQ